MSFTITKKNTTLSSSNLFDIDSLLVKAISQSLSINFGDTIKITLKGVDLKNNFPVQFFIKSNQTLSNGKLFTSQGIEINPIQATNFLLPDNQLVFRSTGTTSISENIKFFIRTVPPIGSSEPVINSSFGNIKIDISSNTNPISEDNLKKLIEFFNSVKKPQITLVTEFKSLFDFRGNLTEIGKSFFEKFSSISNINNILKTSLIGSNFINQTQKNNKIEIYGILPQITKEIQYLKDLNKAVFDATNSVNFLESGFNRSGIVFKGALNNPVANLFFLTAPGVPDEIISRAESIKSSILDFTVRDFLNEIGYDSAFIDSEIKNRFIDSPTKTFLFLLENIKKIHQYHVKIGPKNPKLTISKDDFLILKDLTDQILTQFNPIPPQFNPTIPNPPPLFENFEVISKLDDLIKQKTDSLSSNRNEKIISKFQVFFNDLCYSRTSRNVEDMELLKSYSDSESSNNINTFIEKHIFGKYSEEIKTINNSSSKNSLQHIAITRNQETQQNNVNLEAFDELIENLNNNKYTLTAKSIFVKNSLNLKKDQ
jgi:hypothetical protein